KRLFTISEYYDRDRPAFYQAIQDVRANHMDMTGWLDYFVGGLETQMTEVKQRGERIIRRDVLVRKHGLNGRQGMMLGSFLTGEEFTIQDFEKLFQKTNRRTLQRDLKILADAGLATAKGATHQRVYQLIQKGL
ncbi:MAG: Fic family protein, partial [Lentisphaeria bacterium]|nr:Fic family protein [Lentisphaeria bacterium]